MNHPDFHTGIPDVCAITSAGLACILLSRRPLPSIEKATSVKLATSVKRPKFNIIEQHCVPSKRIFLVISVNTDQFFS
jgi:hypothetical protein